MKIQKITPFLWFDANAEEAVKFYVSLFKNSKILNVTRYGKNAAKASRNEPGRVMTIKFQLEGQEFVAINGGPHFKFTEAISFVVNCGTQKEVDKFWEKLSRDGKKGRCGWLKDKFGLSWQIVPTAAIDMLLDDDAGKSKRMMQALLQMEKINIKRLKEAFKGV